MTRLTEEEVKDLIDERLRYHGLIDDGVGYGYVYGSDYGGSE